MTFLESRTRAVPNARATGMQRRFAERNYEGEAVSARAGRPWRDRC